MVVPICNGTNLKYPKPLVSDNDSISEAIIDNYPTPSLLTNHHHKKWPKQNPALTADEDFTHQELLIKIKDPLWLKY